MKNILNKIIPIVLSLSLCVGAFFISNTRVYAAENYNFSTTGCVVNTNISGTSFLAWNVTSLSFSSNEVIVGYATLKPGNRDEAYFFPINANGYCASITETKLNGFRGEYKSSAQEAIDYVVNHSSGDAGVLTTFYDYYPFDIANSPTMPYTATTYTYNEIVSGSVSLAEFAAEPNIPADIENQFIFEFKERGSTSDVYEYSFTSSGYLFNGVFPYVSDENLFGRELVASKKEFNNGYVLSFFLMDVSGDLFPPQITIKRYSSGLYRHVYQTTNNYFAFPNEQFLGATFKVYPALDEFSSMYGYLPDFGTPGTNNNLTGTGTSDSIFNGGSGMNSGLPSVPNDISEYLNTQTMQSYINLLAGFFTFLPTWLWILLGWSAVATVTIAIIKRVLD